MSEQQVNQKCSLVHLGNGAPTRRFLGHGDPDELIEKTRRSIEGEIEALQRSLKAIDRWRVTRES